VPHEFDAKQYMRFSKHQKEWGRRLMAELSLKGNERILDLGCGDGVLTAQLAALVPKGSVVGIDASRRMIETARTHERPNLSFVVRDINDLNETEAYDVVFSNATLHWIHNHHALLARVYRALAPSGTLRFNFGGDGNCVHFLKIIREAMARPEFARHFAAFSWPWFMPSVEAYLGFMSEHEFREARVWGENADHYFATEELLTGWVDQPSLVPFMGGVAPEDRPLFREYVLRRMIEETRQPDGRFFETFRRINVFARK
jgi:trans-aconitate methyltransferase